MKNKKKAKLTDISPADNKEMAVTENTDVDTADVTEAVDNTETAEAVADGANEAVDSTEAVEAVADGVAEATESSDTAEIADDDVAEVAESIDTAEIAADGVAEAADSAESDEIESTDSTEGEDSSEAAEAETDANADDAESETAELEAATPDLNEDEEAVVVEAVDEADERTDSVNKATNAYKALGELEGVEEFIKRDGSENSSAEDTDEAVGEESEGAHAEGLDERIIALDEGIKDKRKAVKARNASADEEDGESTRKIDGLFDFIELFVFTLTAVLIITSFFVRHSVVDGDSMLGTLHDGENLLISDLFYDPKVGDIIVVEDFSTDLKKPIVKRVIATGGQTVRIQRDGVYVDGEKLVESYVFTDGLPYEYEVYPSSAIKENDTLVYVAGEYYEFTVPDGELFVMGDHRNKSTDSRQIGTVDEDAVLGRVILRFYPFDKFGSVD